MQDNSSNTSAVSEISLIDAKKYIDSIDFSMIIEKMVKTAGWLREDAIETCQQYKNFLFLNKKYGKNFSMPPSEDIDEFWHFHILDTQKYTKDCHMIFNHYLHHDPNTSDGTVAPEKGRKDMDKLFEVTKELYKKEFGQEIEATRSRYPKVIYSFMRLVS